MAVQYGLQLLKQPTVRMRGGWKNLSSFIQIATLAGELLLLRSMIVPMDGILDTRTGRSIPDFREYSVAATKGLVL